MYMVKCNDHAFDLESTATDLENSFSTTKVQNTKIILMEEMKTEADQIKGTFNITHNLAEVIKTKKRP